MIWPASLHGIKHQTWRVSLLGNTWAVLYLQNKKGQSQARVSRRFKQLQLKRPTTLSKENYYKWHEVAVSSVV